MLKDKFVRSSAFLFIAMMMGNVFGYLFQIAMGRMLSVEEYGEINALMSLMVIFGIPFITLLNFFARESSVCLANGTLNSVRSIHKTGSFKIFLIITPIIGILALLSPIIGNYLGVTFQKVLLVLACVYITAFVTVNTGVIQGIQYFRGLSVISGGTSFFKFAYAVFFVWIGWGVYGALGGLLSTAVTLWGYSQWIILSSLPLEKKTIHLSFEEIYKYIGGLFLANLFFNAMTQADVMLVKHYFSSHEAGIYASAAVVGKAVMYLPGAIVLSLFPMVAANKATGDSSINMLIKASVITIILSGSGVVILYIFPEFVMGSLFGTRYLSAASITALFGLAMLPMAFILLLMNYMLAQGRINFVGFMVPSVILEFVGIHFYRDTLQGVLYVIMMAGCITLIPMVLIIYYNHFTTCKSDGDYNKLKENIKLQNLHF